MKSADKLQSTILISYQHVNIKQARTRTWSVTKQQRFFKCGDVLTFDLYQHQQSQDG